MSSTHPHGLCLQRRCLTGAILLAVSCFALKSFADEKTTYKLPSDPEALVISFDQHSGFTLPRKSATPILSIQADGTVLMPDVYGTSRDIKGKISQEELQAILRLAIEDNKFFSHDNAKIKKRIDEIEKTRQIPKIADAPVSAFEIRLADRNHEASQYALGFAVTAYPEIEELKRLTKFQERLRRLMNETRVGGQKGVEKLLEAANAELKKQYPDLKPFDSSNFRGSYFQRDGVLSVTISRNGMTSEGKPDGTFTVAVMKVPEKGEPEVTLRVKTKP